MSRALLESSPSDEERIPEAKEGKSEDVFEVQEILSHALEDGAIKFLVRWAGYGPEEDTWEPEADLKLTAKRVVKKYYKKQKVANKDELIEKINKKKTPKTPKRAREESEDNSSGGESDASFSDRKSSAKKQKRGRKSKTSNSANSVKSTVPTKAALKSYETPIPPPNNAKKAALEIRGGRWLDDSSDDDQELPQESEIDKLLNKVKAKKPATEEPSQNGRTSVEPGCSSSTVMSTSVSLFLNGSKEPSVPRQRSLAPPVKLVEEEPLWVVSGIARHLDDQNRRTKIILMKNTKTGDQKVLGPKDAFELSGWSLTKYLLDRCEF